MRLIRSVASLELHKTAKMINESNEKKTKKNSVPIVHSKDVWMMCEALGIEAQLASFGDEWPKKDKIAPNTRSKQITIPIVQSREIWLFCNALDLKAELASGTD
ncbi:hypothetical protein CDAR_304191 [Caerostris darwini]|uniref:Uncharacterized protein n=1 Tax=Caerostris darwini TaxID=1538125 RepID=A0AAV4WBT7_9ARAC|nr:hypothetical protein CDAR_304191 [Caerostris darwini]